MPSSLSSGFLKSSLLMKVGARGMPPRQAYTSGLPNATALAPSARDLTTWEPSYSLPDIMRLVSIPLSLALAMAPRQATVGRPRSLMLAMGLIPVPPSFPSIVMASTPSLLATSITLSRSR